MSAERERDLILAWLEKRHPSVLRELVEACREALQAGTAAEARTPNPLVRRTRDGRHVVTLRALTGRDLASIGLLASRYLTETA